VRRNTVTGGKPTDVRVRVGVSWIWSFIESATTLDESLLVREM
jgi:hypothetical protein